MEVPHLSLVLVVLSSLCFDEGGNALVSFRAQRQLLLSKLCDLLFELYVGLGKFSDGGAESERSFVRRRRRAESSGASKRSRQKES